MRYLSILLTLVIICILAVWMFRQFGMTDNSSQDVGSVKWYYSHDQERKAKLDECNQNPQMQDSRECRNATQAQTDIDVEKQQQQSGE